MNKILIQANNLDTVIDVFMYIYLHKGCTKQDIANYVGFSLRQVDYYTNACKYLDLIGNEYSPTPLAEYIFKNKPAEVTECVYERIISDDIIGKIFARMYVFPNEDCVQFANNLIKDKFPGYSNAVYDRRSKNLVLWCNKILNYLSIK